MMDLMRAHMLLRGLGGCCCVGVCRTIIGRTGESVVTGSIAALVYVIVTAWLAWIAIRVLH